VIAVGQPVFRVGSKLVQVDVVVRTDKGAVKGLTKDDFTIQDKGRIRPLAVFGVTEKAAATANLTPLPPGVVSNRLGSRGETAQNPTIILFDRLNIQDATDQANSRTRTLALLKALKPTDNVGLYSLFDKITVIQEFTEPADRLAEAANAVDAQTAGSAQGVTGRPEGGAQSRPAVRQTDPCTHHQRSVSGHRPAIAGSSWRKNLIWLTSTIPLTFGQSIERRENDQNEINNYAQILSEGNIALYTIDPRGAGSSSAVSTSGATRADGTRPGTSTDGKNPTEGSRLGGTLNNQAQSGEYSFRHAGHANDRRANRRQGLYKRERRLSALARNSGFRRSNLHAWFLRR
jgi:VWFA-related protein